ncbi:uncharacterized protein LOC125671967 [Ostrea edulis]|uniref:uncharacterized protein LOC125671967 n=1 Tax=Ostrea edulis TaxID=37623 RepID=UPI0024AFD907|nr:uncharacterized protein LOC125671967 [Ostrea edulis]
MTKESDITSAQTPKRDNSGRRGLETTEKLVHITAETGAILGEIQSYLLSQDITENKCPTRTTAIECNASEDDTALISQKSQIMDIKESQTREGGSGSGWDDQDNNKKHTCLESLFRCLCDCGFPRPTKKEKPFTGNRKRGLFQRLGQLFKRN